VLLGGMGPNAIRRVATWGDGWLPIGTPPDALGKARAEIDRIARERGRDPKRISISIMTGAPPGLEEPALDLIPGSDVVAAYQAAGAERLVVSIPTLGGDAAKRHLDRVATLVNG
jgi:hypothetical protein